MSIFRKSGKDKGEEQSPAPFDPVSFILSQPFGFIVYWRAKTAGETVTIFLVREDVAYIAGLPQVVSVVCRAGLFEISDVALIAVLMEIEGKIYETWWSWYDPEQRLCFDDLLRQDKLLVSFYAEETEPVRTIQVPNHFRKSIKPLIAAVQGIQQWSLEEFVKAKEEASIRYPDTRSLWEAMA